jgi:hypothetical protein
MARDKEKNAVMTVTIPRSSPLFKRLMLDAENTGIAVSKLIVLRANDFYETRGSTVVMTSPPSSDEMTDIDLEPEPETNDTQATLNAEDAFDAW